MKIPEQSRFAVYALGIFVSYFLYGIVQEKLTRGRYGDQVQTDGNVGERYTYTLALVWVQCICNYLFAKGSRQLSNISFVYILTTTYYLLGFRHAHGETAKGRHHTHGLLCGQLIDIPVGHGLDQYGFTLGALSHRRCGQIS